MNTSPSDTPDEAPPHTLVDVLDRLSSLSSAGGGEPVTVARLMRAIGRRSYGPLLLLIGLISISPLTAAPGATWFAASITLALSAQMALGASHPWLPREALTAQVPVLALQRAAAAAKPCARRVDAVLRPRLTWLIDPPFVFVTALACIAAALLTFPLGLIPLAPIAPGLAVSLFGLALTTRDGLIAGFGWSCLGAIGWLAYAAIG
jgi:hypothetical protein